MTPKYKLGDRVLTNTDKVIEIAQIIISYNFIKYSTSVEVGSRWWTEDVAARYWDERDIKYKIKISKDQE